MPECDFGSSSISNYTYPIYAECITNVTLSDSRRSVRDAFHIIKKPSINEQVSVHPNPVQNFLRIEAPMELSSYEGDVNFN